ncbi:MAG: sigma-54-dependent transcriptional regulator [Candidatus Cloacimonadia bacterium]
MNILVVDDDANLRYSFKKIFKGTEHNIFENENGLEALHILETQPIDMVFMDIRMSQMDGITALKKIKLLDSSLPVVLMTAYSTTDTTIETMKYGAFDYIVKPFDIAEIVAIVEKVERNKELQAREKNYLAINPQRETGDRIIGSSKSMQRVYKLIGKVAATDIPVLITGESGTGKELVARALHLYSNRKNERFVPVNCAAIPNELLESEVFGYEKGAFTNAEARKIGKFEFANKGTIFLDEIGNMSPAIQSKILRVLQEGSFERLGSNQVRKVNVRIIAATNTNLEEAIEKGEFRKDLFYRLNTVTIHLPPLRERKDDIEDLTKYFIQKFNNSLNKNITKIPEESLRKLQGYDWPGNVRELENVIKQAMVLSNSEVLLSEYLNIPDSREEKELSQISGHPSETDVTKLKALLRQIASQYKGNILEQLESITIDVAMELSNNNQTKAAQLLGINRITLQNKLKKYGKKK